MTLELHLYNLACYLGCGPAETNDTTWSQMRSTTASRIFDTATRVWITALSRRPHRCWTSSTSSRYSSDEIALVSLSTGFPEGAASVRNVGLKGGGGAFIRTISGQTFGRTQRRSLGETGFVLFCQGTNFASSHLRHAAASPISRIAYPCVCVWWQCVKRRGW